MTQTDNMVLSIAIPIVVAVILIALTVSILSRLRSFSEELRYINMELGRCSARMRPKWRRRRRRLWCSLLIPFYRY